MACRRNGKFKLRAIRPSAAMVARAAPAQVLAPSRWYARMLAQELFRLRMRVDLLERA
jgi:hypothetical protein